MTHILTIHPKVFTPCIYEKFMHPAFSVSVLAYERFGFRDISH